VDCSKVNDFKTFSIKLFKTSDTIFSHSDFFYSSLTILNKDGVMKLGIVFVWVHCVNLTDLGGNSSSILLPLQYFSFPAFEILGSFHSQRSLVLE